MIKVAAALIITRNSFLITRRTQGELPGTWEFPGGKIKANETAFEAVKREINEELGIDIFPYQKLRSFIYPYSFGKVPCT